MIIIDSHNFYRTVRAKFGADMRVDYTKLLHDRSVVVGYENQNFENFLRMAGYEVELVEGSGNDTTFMLMIAQIIRLYDRHITLGTQDKRIVPVIHALQGKGVYVEVIGAGIPPELRVASNKWIELSEEILCTIVS